MRGTNLFHSIAKSILDTSMGRIYWRTNMWARVGSVYDKNRCLSPVFPNGMFSYNKNLVLVRTSCTSNCPKPPIVDAFAVTGAAHHGAWVPARVCRKCLYHRPASSKIRFPRCMYKAEPTPAESAAKTFGKLVHKAERATETMLGRK